ncbi:hypothetical protein EK21DRAFT_83475 [Setomelanomma holmii]|uniref:Uncharacterized protein n=1 Tax=Setomelanomma holmii TaxID=210430 RepID=A0A9P4LSK2_9PLEO|nr:hypothetical protein EK21DRAFT_83475 [Setomelanomma holmii]
MSLCRWMLKSPRSYGSTTIIQRPTTIHIEAASPPRSLETQFSMATSAGPRVNNQQPGATAALDCDDKLCCNMQGDCDQNNRNNCPGIGALGPTPLSRSGRNHPHAQNVTVCQTCRAHLQAIYTNSVNWNATLNVSGPVVNLCVDCEYEEMKLYWQRREDAAFIRPPVVGTPDVAPSIAHVATWPQGPIHLPSNQNLCICQHNVNTAGQVWMCHACRDQTHIIQHQRPWTDAENILRTRKKNVIKGRMQCTRNGAPPGQDHLELDTVINERRARGIARLCPCGKEPHIPTNPAHAFILICLACMGVKINAAHIPLNLRRLYIHGGQPSRPVRRSSRLRAVGRPTPVPPRRLRKTTTTLGPRRAPRSKNFRVNIERGWDHFKVGGDPFIGGV